VGREAWSATFVSFGFVDGRFLMSGNGAPADSSPDPRLAAATIAAAAAVNPAWPAGEVLHGGASQLMTISGASERRSHCRVLMMLAAGGVRLCVGRFCAGGRVIR
jgi:hypothetical protein